MASRNAIAFFTVLLQGLGFHSGGQGASTSAPTSVPPSVCSTERPAEEVAAKLRKTVAPSEEQRDGKGWAGEGLPERTHRKREHAREHEHRASKRHDRAGGGEDADRETMSRYHAHRCSSGDHDIERNHHREHRYERRERSSHREDKHRSSSRHSHDRSRENDRHRHERSGRHRDHRELQRDTWDKDVRAPASKEEKGMDLQSLIPGYKAMSKVQQMKARTKLLLQESGKKDGGAKQEGQWTRFVFNKVTGCSLYLKRQSSIRGK